MDMGALLTCDGQEQSVKNKSEFTNVEKYRSSLHLRMEMIFVQSLVKSQVKFRVKVIGPNPSNRAVQVMEGQLV